VKGCHDGRDEFSTQELFFIDFAKGKTYKKGVEELNYK